MCRGEFKSFGEDIYLSGRKGCVGKVNNLRFYPCFWFYLMSCIIRCGAKNVSCFGMSFLRGDWKHGNEDVLSPDGSIFSVRCDPNIILSSLISG